MPRFPRFPLIIAALVVVYATILTLLVSSGSTGLDAWLYRLFPALGDNNASRAQHTSDNTTVVVTKTHTVTVASTITATSVSTTTVKSIQTIAPTIPGPVYCKECGEDDVLCREYGRHNLERSRGYEGTNTRLKRVLQKAAAGEPINIGVLGGSVTHGHGVVPHQRWSNLFFEWWNTTFPHKDNIFVNGAVPATGTAYFSVCGLEHIDENVDLVIIEMAINDLRGETSAMTYELLVRLLLDLPHKPAIISNHVFSIHFEYLATGGDNHLAVAQYYDIPYINLRHVLLNNVLEHENLVPEFFHPQAPLSADLPLDTRHMNRAGHQMMTDLLIAYIQRQICRIAADAANPVPPFASKDNLLSTLDTMEQVPRLRLFEHYVPNVRTQPTHPTCMSTRAKKHPLKASQTDGWSHWSWKDKSYLVAREVGASVTFDIRVGPMGAVEVEYLRSKIFGLGMVRCWVGNNEAGGTTIDGYWDLELNIARTSGIAYNQSPGPQTVTCKALETTSDPNGGHEFRMIALTSY